MLCKTRGLVLGATRFSETSLVARIYTERFGMQSYMVNGVRTAKPRFSPLLLQPMAFLEMVVYHRDGRGVQRVSELRSAHNYTLLPYDMLRSSVGLFMTEVLGKSIHGQEEYPGLFGFLEEWFSGLDSGKESVANYPACFMLNLSRHLGFFPRGSHTDKTPWFDLKEGAFVHRRSSLAFGPPLSLAASELMDCGPHDCGRVQMSRSQRRDLLSHLARFFAFHIDGFGKFKSLPVLEKIAGHY